MDAASSALTEETIAEVTATAKRINMDIQEGTRQQLIEIFRQRSEHAQHVAECDTRAASLLGSDTPITPQNNLTPEQNADAAIRQAGHTLVETPSRPTQVVGAGEEIPEPQENVT